MHSQAEGEAVAARRDQFAELHRVARRRGQRGYFTSEQAQAAGVSRMRLSRLVQQGLVDRVASRVYRFRVAAAPNWKDRLAVELLSTGGRASGLTAAALIDLADPPARPAVLVPRRSRAAVNGRHTTRELSNEECVTVEGLATLNPIRTVLDSVHRLPPSKATALVESAIVRGLVKPEDLRRRARELLQASARAARSC